MSNDTRLSLILMSDDGARRTLRVRRGRFYAFMICLFCFPLLAAGLGWWSFQLWRSNAALTAEQVRLERALLEAEATAERLENLEILLKEQNVDGRRLLAHRLVGHSEATASVEPEESPEVQKEMEQALKQPSEGPGHAEFPAVASDLVKVLNVRARSLGNGRLRVSLDLRNTERQKVVSGVVEVTLLTADGQQHAVSFEPDDVGDFRISRFKRAVMVSRLPRSVGKLENSQVIIEVKKTDGELLFRNIFAVER